MSNRIDPLLALGLLEFFADLMTREQHEEAKQIIANSTPLDDRVDPGKESGDALEG
jgi:hypothetical protein